MTKPFKPTFPQLAFLEWLNERRGCRFAVKSSGSTDFDLFETDGRNEENGKLKLKRYAGWGGDAESKALTKRLGGSRGKVDLSTLLQEKILKSGNSLYGAAGTLNYDSFVEQLDVASDFFHYSTTVYLVNKDVGYAYWDEIGKPLFDEMLAKRSNDRAKAERLILVGRVAPIEPRWPAALIKKLPAGLRFPIPSRTGLRPEAYATVVKETDKRLYVEDIHSVREFSSRGTSVIQGYKEKYVEREHVIIDNATPEIIRKLTALDTEYEDDVTRIAVDFAERMLPLMQEMDSRFFQKDNERELVFNEAINEFNAARQDASPTKKR
ncbi:hypothetical protein G6L37_01040 [Agrobacterium rubi]|nr:hypothetical protein [Agrobacterium rubi]NTF23977.1 hypothetical protein [Agrobacterium rubi]